MIQVSGVISHPHTVHKMAQSGCIDAGFTGHHPFKRFQGTAKRCIAFRTEIVVPFQRLIQLSGDLYQLCISILVEWLDQQGEFFPKPFHNPLQFYKRIAFPIQACLPCTDRTGSVPSGSCSRSWQRLRLDLAISSRQKQVCTVSLMASVLQWKTLDIDAHSAELFHPVRIGHGGFRKPVVHQLILSFWLYGQL